MGRRKPRRGRRCGGRRPWRRQYDGVLRSGSRDGDVDGGDDGRAYGMACTMSVLTDSPKRLVIRATLSWLSVMKVEGTNRSPSWPFRANRLDSRCPRRRYSKETVDWIT